MSNLYALLIGINCYLPNQLPGGLYYKSLWGCVQDILRVEDFLRDGLGVPPERIFRLTSSSSDSDPPQPPEPPEQWPTYANIVKAFRQLGNLAQPGDQVYIHYSGHGGRTPTTREFHAIKGPDGLDEVLVPADLGNSEGRYLRDTELHKLLKELVDKELIVTLVLDSCHAGGATRGHDLVVDPELGGAGIRGIGVVDTTPRPVESLVAPAGELVETWQGSTKNDQRAVQTGSSWLLEPEGYVLIAACRAHEYANEVVFEGTKKNGALTYWLVDSYKQMGPGFTYKMLHNRIVAKVHGQFAEQTPQLQGEGDRVVFGTGAAPSQNAVTVVKVNPDQTVELNAGQAHGIRAGSQFSVYALDETDFTRNDHRVALIEALEAGAVTSNAKILNAFGSKPIEAGCQAVLLESGAVQLRRRVRLADRKNGLAKSDYAAALGNVERALAARSQGFISLASSGESPDYVITVGETGEYVVCDTGGVAISNLRPSFGVNDNNAATHLVDRLVHLAKYANVRALDNNSSQSALSRNLIVELTGVQTDYFPGDQPEPRPFDPAGANSLKSGEWTFLRIQNNYSEVLNITVLDLQPDWAISQIYPARAGAFEALDPGKELVLSLRVSLPEGYKSGTDIIKVFATLQATSFRWLELPALDQPGAGDNLRGLPTNSLEAFLSAFSSEDAGTRRVEMLTIANVEWVAHQVEIEIQG